MAIRLKTSRGSAIRVGKKTVEPIYCSIYGCSNHSGAGVVLLADIGNRDYVKKIPICGPCLDKLR